MTETYELVGSIRRSLHAIRDHYDGALDGPRRAGSVGGSAGSKEPPAPVGLHILDARRDAHLDLAHYARVVYMACTDVNGNPITTRITEDERQQPHALADFLDTWADRLADADPTEAAACDRDMARHAKALRSLALPDRRDWVPLGPCPIELEDGLCGFLVKAFPEKQTINCSGCGTEGDLYWWMAMLAPEGADLATADGVIACVAGRTGEVLTHDRVWKWGQRGVILTHGKDAKGRTLYSKAAVLAYATDKIKEDVA